MGSSDDIAGDEEEIDEDIIEFENHKNSEFNPSFVSTAPRRKKPRE